MLSIGDIAVTQVLPSYGSQFCELVGLLLVLSDKLVR